jgi:pteridine reductase
VHGKVVLITGGAKRVGAAISRKLHAAGANLMLHYRASAGEARLLQAELNHVRAGSVALIQADILDVGKLPSLVEQTLATFGRLDALVNNASSFFATQVGDITPAAWEDLIGTNLRAPLFLSQAAAPALKRAQGAIVNITDIHAERPLKGYVVYSAAKAGLSGLTRSLARELAPEVRVNAVRCASACCASSCAEACCRAMMRRQWRNGNMAAASPSTARCASRPPTAPGASGCCAIAPGQRSPSTGCASATASTSSTTPRNRAPAAAARNS